MDPGETLTMNVLGGWAKKRLTIVGITEYIGAAWDKEVQEPSRKGHTRGPISLIVTKVRELGWEPDQPGKWRDHNRDVIEPDPSGDFWARLKQRIADLRWAKLAARRSDFEGAEGGVDEATSFGTAFRRRGAGDGEFASAWPR